MNGRSMDDSIQLFYLASQRGCIPVYKAAIVKGSFVFAYHCPCDKGIHGEKKTGLITLESLGIKKRG